jgi:hypothetical protein
VSRVPAQPGSPDPTTGAYLLWTDGAGQHTFVFDCVISEDWTEPVQITEHPVEDGPNVTDNIRIGLISCRLQIRATNEPIQDNQWATMGAQSLPLQVPAPQWIPASGALIVPVWQSGIGLKSGLADLAGAVLGAGGAVAAIALGSLLPGAALPTIVVPGQGLAPTSIAPSSQVNATSDTFTEPDDFVLKTYAQLQTLKNTPQLVQVIGTKCVASNMAIDDLQLHRAQDTGTGASISLSLRQILLVTTATVPTPTVARATPPVTNGHQATTDVDPAHQQSVAHSLLSSGASGGVLSGAGVGLQ